MTTQFVNFYQHLGITQYEERASARWKILQALLSNHPDKWIGHKNEIQMLVIDKTCILNAGKEVFRSSQSLGAWKFRNRLPLHHWFRDPSSCHSAATGFFDPTEYLTWGSDDAYFFDVKRSKANDTKAKIDLKIQEQRAKEAETISSKEKASYERRQDQQKPEEKEVKKGRGTTKKKPQATKGIPKNSSKAHRASNNPANDRPSKKPISPERPHAGTGDDGPAYRTRSKTWKQRNRPGLYGDNIADQYESIPGYRNAYKKRTAKTAGLDDDDIACPIQERRPAPY